MPTTTTRFAHHQASRRDSWPPTQMRIFNSIEEEEDVHPMEMDKHHPQDHAHSFIDDDEDPMNSFLTPTPLLDDGDTDDEDMEDDDMGFAFDAGIEDPLHPAPVVRSISPSQLASGGLPRPPSTPPRAIPVPIRTPSPPSLHHNNNHHHHHHLHHQHHLQLPHHQHLPHHLNHHFLRPGSYSPPSLSSPEVTTPMLDHDDDGHDDDDDDDEEEEEDYVRFTPRGGLAVPSPFHLGTPNANARASSKMRRAKAAAVSAAKAQEKEEDRVALMMMMAARGTHHHHRHHHDDSSDDDDDDDDDAVPLSSSSSPSSSGPASTPWVLAPSPVFHVGSPPRTNRNNSSSLSTPSAPTRGRSARPALGRRPPVLPSRPRGWSGGNGRSSPRAWREPSPDVWSIEEEEEEDEEEEGDDEVSVVGDEMEMEGGAHEHHHHKDKGKKRVRFAWPVREEIP